MFFTRSLWVTHYTIPSRARVQRSAGVVFLPLCKNFSPEFTPVPQAVSEDSEYSELTKYEKLQYSINYHQKSITQGGVDRFEGPPRGRVITPS